MIGIDVKIAGVGHYGFYAPAGFDGPCTGLRSLCFHRVNRFRPVSFIFPSWQPLAELGYASSDAPARCLLPGCAGMFWAPVAPRCYRPIYHNRFLYEAQFSFELRTFLLIVIFGLFEFLRSLRNRIRVRLLARISPDWLHLERRWGRLNVLINTGLLKSQINIYELSSCSFSCHDKSLLCIKTPGWRLCYQMGFK